MELAGVKELIPSEWKDSPNIPFVALISKSQSPKWQIIEAIAKSMPHINRGNEKRPLYVIAVERDKESISKFCALLELTMNMSNCFVFVKGREFFKQRWTLLEILYCYIRSFEIKKKEYWCQKIEIFAKELKKVPIKAFVEITFIDSELPEEEKERLIKKDMKENKRLLPALKLSLPCKHQSFVRRFTDDWLEELQNKFEEYKEEILSNRKAREDFVMSVALESGCFYCPNFNLSSFSIQEIYMIAKSV